MVSEYLNHIRTMPELDQLFEKDRQAAAQIAEVLLNQQSTTAIHTISEIHQIANVRIESDSSVASARIMANAEVCSVELLSTAEIAMLDIQKQDITASQSVEIMSSMVREIGHQTQKSVSKKAQAAIDSIQETAKESMKLISQNAKISIKQIERYVAETDLRVKECAGVARDKLEKEQMQSRTTEQTSISADTAATKVLNKAAEVSYILVKKVEEAINAINTLTDETLTGIKTSVLAAENLILQARDGSLSKIQDILAIKQN